MLRLMSNKYVDLLKSQMMYCEDDKKKETSSIDLIIALSVCKSFLK